MYAQIKTKERVRNHGEVFTAEREVTAMLDLVKEETRNIDSTFLEPACGDGNFLVEIWRRKLNTVFKVSGGNDADCEYWATRAISSIYGIDIQQDNVIETQERLYNDFFARYVRTYRHKPSRICLNSILFILSQNIQCGDTLKSKKEDGTPLMITKWAFDENNGLTISLFDYAEMVKSGSTCNPVYKLPRINYLLLPAIYNRQAK